MVLRDMTARVGDEEEGLAFMIGKENGSCDGIKRDGGWQRIGGSDREVIGGGGGSGGGNGGPTTDKKLLCLLVLSRPPHPWLTPCFVAEGARELL